MTTKSSDEATVEHWTGDASGAGRMAVPDLHRLESRSRSHSWCQTFDGRAGRRPGGALLLNPAVRARPATPGIQIRVGLPIAALAAAELAALAAAADVLGTAGCRGDTSAAATFSSAENPHLCVVSLLTSSDS